MLDPGRDDVRGGVTAGRLGQADLEGLGAAEFLDAGFAEVHLVDLDPQLLDIDRLGEGHPDQLPADEIDAEVQPAIRGERERGRGRDQRQHQREVAPAHEVEVRVIGNELEQLHRREP